MSDITIGERQTVDHAKHPTLGEGRAVYDNGPCFFIADNGEVEHFACVIGCGVQSRPLRSYVEFQQAAGKKIQVETTGRRRGHRHTRIVTIDGRAGWLVTWSDAESKAGPFWWHRFESDGGESQVMKVGAMWVGKANEKKARSKRTEPWTTLEAIDGAFFVYCNEADDPRKKLAMPGPDATHNKIAKWKAAIA